MLFYWFLRELPLFSETSLDSPSFFFVVVNLPGLLLIECRKQGVFFPPSSFVLLWFGWGFCFWGGRGSEVGVCFWVFFTYSCCRSNWVTKEGKGKRGSLVTSKYPRCCGYRGFLVGLLFPLHFPCPKSILYPF